MLPQNGGGAEVFFAACICDMSVLDILMYWMSCIGCLDTHLRNVCIGGLDVLSLLYVCITCLYCMSVLDVTCDMSVLNVLMSCGVVLVSRINKIIGFFCKRAL